MVVIFSCAKYGNYNFLSLELDERYFLTKAIFETCLSNADAPATIIFSLSNETCEKALPNFIIIPLKAVLEAFCEG